MELIDYYVGIIITIVVVVVVEYVVHYLKESFANDQIIKSLLGEVSLNLDIVRIELAQYRVVIRSSFFKKYRKIPVYDIH